jgi:translation initiation factor IF-3
MIDVETLLLLEAGRGVGVSLRSVGREVARSQILRTLLKKVVGVKRMERRER